VETVKYRNWVLSVDRGKTEAVYQQVEKNGTQSCGCDSCQYFETVADEVFPDEVKQLFKQLGVDIKKNFNVTDFGDGSGGYTFDGQFHFKGDLIEGDDCYELTKHGGYQVNLVLVNDNFKIGFTKIASQSFFNEDKEVVQIEFMARVS
jgi:hypothetical protein